MYRSGAIAVPPSRPRLLRKRSLALTNRRRAEDVGKHNINNNDESSLYNHDNSPRGVASTSAPVIGERARSPWLNVAGNVRAVHNVSMCPCAYSNFHIVKEPLHCYGRQHVETLNSHCSSAQAVPARQLLRSDVEEQYIDSGRSPP
jgi:hypothetical protein